jgi:5-methylcytosine-specific restriction endonuclease McrA
VSRTGWNGRRVRAFTAAVLITYGDRCHLCGLRGATTADHLIPRSKGGAWWDVRNARPAHGPCNSARGDMDLTEWFRGHPLPTRPALTPSREW